LSSEEFPDEEYIEQIQEIDSTIQQMLILFSLILAFILTSVISIYVNNLAVGIILQSYFFGIALVNAIGLMWGIYVISLPNQPKFLKKYFPHKWITFTFKKDAKYTQEEYFNIIVKYYIRTRWLFWISIVSSIILIGLLWVLSTFGWSLP